MNNTDNIVQQQLRESFPEKMSLGEEKLMEKIKNGRLFSGVQCVIEYERNPGIVTPSFHHYSRTKKVPK